jgi:hypothetical protein
LTSALTELPIAGIPLGASQYYAIQRRGARIRLRERLPVQLNFWDGHFVDISRSGALVEHTERIRLGEVYRLAFPGERRQVQVLARAIRSFVSRLVHKSTRAMVRGRSCVGRGWSSWGARAESPTLSPPLSTRCANKNRKAKHLCQGAKRKAHGA